MRDTRASKERCLSCWRRCRGDATSIVGHEQLDDPGAAAAAMWGPSYVPAVRPLRAMPASPPRRMAARSGLSLTCHPNHDQRGRKAPHRGPQTRRSPPRERHGGALRLTAPHDTRRPHNPKVAGSNPAPATIVMSRDIGKGRTCIGFGPWSFSAGLVAAGGVEGEVAEEFACGGCDDADVEVGDDEHDGCAGVGPADAYRAVIRSTVTVPPSRR